MEVKSPVLYFFKILIIILKDIFFFPVWWYTIGFWHFLLFLKNILINLQKNLAFFIWLKNIFVPMYGQRDFQGVLISILVRISQIIFRGMVLALASVLCLILAVIWLILPIIILKEALWQSSMIEDNFIIKR